MKKLILAAVAIAAIASYNVYRSNSETEGMSATMLANVEALANMEAGNGKVYCCGSVDVCAKILGGGHIVGIPFKTPCP